jgi:hypothetical protein
VALVEISCVEVLREVSNYVDNDVDRELRERMEEHFKGCEHCLAVLDGTRNIVRLVGDGRSFEVPAGFSGRLRSVLAQKLGI